jgi:hypothetical protein
MPVPVMQADCRGGICAIHDPGLLYNGVLRKWFQA